MSSHNPRQHNQIDDAARERIEAYVLGGSSIDERHAFEQHLATCAACLQETQTYDDVGKTLLYSAPASPPPASLKERMLANVRNPKPLLVRANDQAWMPTPVDGVTMRPLYVDPIKRRQTIIVRLEPGASYPIHAHAGPEDCYVLEGVLMDGDLRMTVGDYTRYESGSQHGPLTTETGCEILVIGSLDDRVVA